MKHKIVLLVAAIAAGIGLVVLGCSSAPPAPQPTAAPAKAAEPAKPAAAPAKAPEPTKPVAQPTSAPVAQPTAVPAKKVDFPTKGRAITLIVPWAAGGNADSAARQLAPLLEKELGTPVQIVNKEGASQQVALTELAQAKPDGYTILVLTTESALGTYLDPERKAIYTRESFQPIALYRADPYMMVVKGDSPFKGMKDLMDAAKANPEKVKIASTGGLMSTPHIILLQLEKAASAKLAIVLFEGGGPAVTALMGGHTDASLGTPGNFPQVKSGDMRILGISDKEESVLFPGIKTFEGQGYAVRGMTNVGLIAPAGMPKEIVDVLDSALKKVVDAGELKQKLAAIGSIARYGTRDEFTTVWKKGEEEYKPLLSQFRQK